MSGGIDNYELYIVDTSGNRVAGPLTEALYLEWAIVLSGVGTCYLEINAADWNDAWFNDRLLLQVWRQPRFQASPTLVQSYWLMDYGKRMEAGDVALAWVRGYDMNAVLDWRIVTGAAGSAEAQKTGDACVVMLEYVQEAMLDTYTTAGRALDTAMIFSVVGGTGGPSISYTASRGRLLSVLQGCAGAAITRGTAVRFWVRAIETGGEMRIVTAPLGSDRRAQTPFSPEMGTLYEPAWEYRGGRSATYGYAGGAGQEDNRLVVEVDLSDGTVIGRREAWAENSQIKTAASLYDWMRARLYEQRARTWFGGELRDSELSAFGRDWNLGDLVTCEYDGKSFEAEVMAVTGMASTSGEIVSARVENEILVDYGEIGLWGN